MVTVNGVEMPMRKMSGLLVLETPEGHQNWALIVDATVEYGDAEFTGYESPQMKVVATMPPGELLRTVSTEEVGEENAALFTRLLVHVLREERERYAELEKRHDQRGAALSAAQAENRRLAEDSEEMLWAAWRHGASTGWFHGQGMLGKTLDEVLEMNPHLSRRTRSRGATSAAARTTEAER